MKITLFLPFGIMRYPVFKKLRYSGWARILKLSFCLWKALLKLGGIQIFKVPARARLFLQVENWFSGQWKPFFLVFSEIPTSDSFFSSSRKVFFNKVLHSSWWKRIFCLLETVLFCSEVFTPGRNCH